MSSVTRLHPESQGVNNVPHMLRDLADRIEAGDEGDVRCVLAIVVPNGVGPELFMYGGEGMLWNEQIGILARMQHRAAKAAEA